MLFTLSVNPFGVSNTLQIKISLDIANILTIFTLHICSALPYMQCLRWLNTVLDTCVSFTFFIETLDPLVAKNGSKQVNNANFGVLMVKLKYVSLPWQHE